MAMVGLRDCSIIATPPEGRSAIQTMVAPYAEETIERAIRDELTRGGQVFFVHNRIDTSRRCRRCCSGLCPSVASA